MGALREQKLINPLKLSIEGFFRFLNTNSSLEFFNLKFWIQYGGPKWRKIWLKIQKYKKYS